MLTVAAFVLSFVASTLAYSVTFPNANSGWSDQGAQVIRWIRVRSDAPNVSVELDNQKIDGFQATQLVALAEGGDTNGSVEAQPPSGNWVDGSGFRINLRDVNNNGILAQSEEFSINSSSKTSSSTTTSGTTIVYPATSTPTTGATGTSDSSASDSANILPTSSNSAALSYPVQTGLLGLFSLLGFALA